MALQVPPDFAGRPLVTREFVEHAHAHGLRRARLDDRRARGDARAARARRRRHRDGLPRAARRADSRSALARAASAWRRACTARRPRPGSSRSAPALADAARRGPVLDLACGRGRHALAAAELGAPRSRSTATPRRCARCRPRPRGAGCRCQRCAPTSRRRSESPCGRELRRDPRVSLPVPTARRRRSSTALAPGGLLLYETFTVAQRALGSGPRRAEFLLEPGELPRALLRASSALEYWEGRSDGDRARVPGAPRRAPGLKRRAACARALRRREARERPARVLGEQRVRRLRRGAAAAARATRRPSCPRRPARCAADPGTSRGAARCARVATRQASSSQIEQPGERRRRPLRTRREPRAQPERIRRHAATLARVPGAHLLADVAAEHEIAVRLAQRHAARRRAPRSSGTRCSAWRRARREPAKACVGQASRQARQLPQWSGSRASGASARSVSSAPRNR